MRLTPEQVYQRLIDNFKIFDVKGQTTFYLGDVHIIVKARDVVGNIMQEWLEGWLRQNGVEFLPSENTQMPPDFFLNPSDKTRDLLEVKAFNYEAPPGFDIADFNAYQAEVVSKPYMLHTKYLIFGYRMLPDGYVVIKKMWLKPVWELCRPMELWPLNLQIEEGVVQKIRPGKWYADTKRSRFHHFATMEHFVSALEETVYRNPETRKNSGNWLPRFTDSYAKHYGQRLEIPRWNAIIDNYVVKRQPKRKGETKQSNNHTINRPTD